MRNAVDQLSALANTQRLAVFRLLVRRYPHWVSAGKIAETLSIKASTLSVYLNILRQAGLIEQERCSRSVLYRADTDSTAGLIDYLVSDCCRQRFHPDDAEALSKSVGVGAPPYRVLFLCSHNSARSIFAEAILADLGGDRFQSVSAGTRPADAVHPVVIDVLRAKGIATESMAPKSIAEAVDDAPPPDFVFTVCDTAAGDDWPRLGARPVVSHWSVSDPAEQAAALPDDAARVFGETYTLIEKRIRHFLNGLEKLEEPSHAALQRLADEAALVGQPQ